MTRDIFPQQVSGIEQAMDWTNVKWASVDWKKLKILIDNKVIALKDIELDAAGAKKVIEKLNGQDKEIVTKIAKVSPENIYLVTREIFPQQVSGVELAMDWTNVKWTSVEWSKVKTAIDDTKQVIAPKDIELPGDIAKKGLDDINRKETVKKIVKASTKSRANLLSQAIEGVKEKSNKVSYESANWKGAKWNLVSAFLQKPSPVIELTDLIEGALPGVSKCTTSSLTQRYDWSSLEKDKAQWHAIPLLAQKLNGFKEHGFLKEDYQEIEKITFPNLSFDADGKYVVDQVDWDNLQAYEINNWLIDEDQIDEKILLYAPRDLVKRKIKEATDGSAQDKFWKRASQVRWQKDCQNGASAGLVVGIVGTVSYFMSQNPDAPQNKKQRNTRLRRGDDQKINRKKDRYTKASQGQPKKMFEKHAMVNEKVTPMVEPVSA